MENFDKVFSCKYVNPELTKCWSSTCLASDKHHARDILHFRKENDMVLIEESIKFIGLYKNIDQESKNDLEKTGSNRFQKYDIILYK